MKYVLAYLVTDEGSNEYTDFPPDKAVLKTSATFGGSLEIPTSLRTKFDSVRINFAIPKSIAKDEGFKQVAVWAIEDLFDAGNEGQ